MKRQNGWEEAALVLGGLILASVTLKTYQQFEAPLGLPSQNRLSPSDAEATIRSAKSYLSSHPEDFNAWTQLGIACYYKGPEAYADGLNAIDRARSLGATSETLFYYAGLMEQALGLPEYAANEFSKYLRHHPEDQELQVRLANVLAGEKKWDDASKLYVRLTTQRPLDATLWFNYAIVLKEKGDLDAASSAFLQARQLGHGLPEGGLFQLGEVSRLKGDDAKAVSFYQDELAVHPSYFPALQALESSQRRRGLWKEARLTRQKMSALKPR